MVFYCNRISDTACLCCIPVHYQIGNLFIGGGFGIGTVVAVLLIIGFVYLLVRPYKESATLSVSTNKMFSK